MADADQVFIDLSDPKVSAWYLKLSFERRALVVARVWGYRIVFIIDEEVSARSKTPTLKVLSTRRMGYRG